MMLSLIVSASLLSAAPTPQFSLPSKQQAHAAFVEAETLYKTHQQDWVVFVDMLALGRVRVMQTKNPQYEWNRDVDDLWIGCMTFQFPSVEAFQTIHFQSYLNSDTFYHWIDDNEKLANERADTRDLIARLKLVPDWAANCSSLVDKDKVPQGAETAINVDSKPRETKLLIHQIKRFLEWEDKANLEDSLPLSSDARIALLNRRIGELRELQAETKRENEEIQ